MNGLSLNAMMQGFQSGGSLGSTLASIHNTNTMAGQMDKNRDVVRDQMLLDNSRLNRGLNIEQQKVDNAFELGQGKLANERDLIQKSYEVDKLLANAKARNLDANTAHQLQQTKIELDTEKGRQLANSTAKLQQVVQKYKGDWNAAAKDPEFKGAVEASMKLAAPNFSLNRPHIQENAALEIQDVGNGSFIAGAQDKAGKSVPFTKDPNTRYAEVGNHAEAGVPVVNYAEAGRLLIGQASKHLNGGLSDFENYQAVAQFQADMEQGVATIASQALAATGTANLTGEKGTGLSLLKGEAYTDQGKKEEAVRNTAATRIATTPTDQLAQEEQNAFIIGEGTNNAKAAALDTKVTNQLQLALTRMQRKNDRWFDDIRDWWDSNDPLENHTVADVKYMLKSMLSHDRSRQRLKETMPNPFKGDMPSTPEEWTRLLEWVGKNPRVIKNWEEGKDTYGDSY